MNAASSSGAHAVGKSRSIRWTGNRVTATPATGGPEIRSSAPSVDVNATKARKIQNTHWYRVGWASFSANPHTADEMEIRRVGLHSCTARNCPEEHAWSAEEYYRVQILKQWAEEGFY